MGLSDKDFKEEENSLKMMGIPTEVKPIDKQVDDYFSKKREEKKKTVLKNINISKRDDTLLTVKTWGFKDGVLQHNMPCPVCLKKPAKYISSEDVHYFGPCEVCETLGFKLENTKRKKGWFS
jgi:hypothetical protein